MSAHLFYADDLQQKFIAFDEEASRHIGVLRLQPGDAIEVTDGKGRLAKASITSGHRKKATATIIEKKILQKTKSSVTIAISPTKNASRFEWFLEKATEIGIDEIIPLICSRTEKQKIRMDRMQNILISAMLQSRQVWLPVLTEPQDFDAVLDYPGRKFIAHCIEDDKNDLLTAIADYNGDCLLMIGPEGDFTAAEIQQALAKNFIAVSLGATRLRTETAGIAGATLLRMGR